MELLKSLVKIHAPSGEEGPISAFLVDYINREQKNWKVQPRLYYGDDFQDSLVLKFGEPRTAIFAHMDTTGFTVRYDNQLLAIGSPEAEPGTFLVGHDSLGPIECVLDFDGDHHALYRFARPIERGTSLTYQVNFQETSRWIESPYLDNRLGVYVALKVAETLENGAIVFSCWEEHGGGSVPYLARFIYEQWKIRQALIADITWITEGVLPEQGVAISMRDQNIPRRVYIDRIAKIAQENNIPFQLEVEGMGSSDGRELQTSPYPFDWCFVGAPEERPHTPRERVYKKDISSMVKLYQCLMREL